MSQTTATQTKKKELYQWLSTDHSEKCVKAKEEFDAKQNAEMQAAKKANKPFPPVRAFKCLNEAECCPDNIVINAGTAPLIIGAAAKVPDDSPRMDPGDRRQGDYYLSLLGLPGMIGLQPVKKVPLKRLAELEKIRKQRNGELPADWIVEAREKAAKGGGPDPIDPRAGLTSLQKAALGMAPD